MNLESKDIIEQPVERVYALVRDDLPALVPYLPNVERITVLQSERLDDSQVRCVNHWFAKADMPALAKKFIKPELFSWKDTALWNDAERVVEYELESALANDLYDANGKNFFKDAGNGKTELIVTCDVTIHADRVPGVPKLMAKKVVPMVETILTKLLQPNLTSLAGGLRQYFENAPS